MMRVRLEKYYRFSFVFCLAFFVQVVMIFSVMFNAFKNLFRINMSWYTAFEFFNLLFAYRHLNQKDKDKYREWRRREVTVKTVSMKRSKIDTEADLGNGEYLLSSDELSSRH